MGRGLSYAQGGEGLNQKKVISQNQIVFCPKSKMSIINSQQDLIKSLQQEVAQSDRHCLELIGQVRSLKSYKEYIYREKMEVEEALRLSLESGQKLKDALLEADLRIAQLEAEKAALQQRLELLLNPPDSDSE